MMHVMLHVMFHPGSGLVRLASHRGGVACETVTPLDHNSLEG